MKRSGIINMIIYRKEPVYCPNGDGTEEAMNGKLMWRTGYFKIYRKYTGRVVASFDSDCGYADEYKEDKYEISEVEYGLSKINDPFELLQYNYENGLIKYNYYTSSHHWKELGPCARAGELEREGL